MIFDGTSIKCQLYFTSSVNHATAEAKLQKTLASDWSPKYKLVSFSNFINELKGKNNGN